MDNQRHFRKKLRFSEAQFEAIARTATDSIIISDESSVIIFANKKTYEIFGYGEGELTDMNLGILMPEKYRAAHKAGVRRYIDSGNPKIIGHTIEIEGLRKDGSVFPLELSLSSWKEENRCFFSGIIRDITKRKQFLTEKEEAGRLLQEQQKELKATNEELQAMHQELLAAYEEVQSSQEEIKAANEELEKRVQQRVLQLEQQREWIHNLFMQVPALIGLLKGREGVVTLFNEMFSRLWGNREVLGKTMREAWPELEGQGYFEFVENIYDTGETGIQNEYPAMIDRHNNGQPEPAYFNFIYAPYYDTNGEIEGTIIYGEDVTAQVLARRTVEESAERFRFMADAMPQKVWTAKADGNINYCNQKWLDYTGLTFDELKDWGWKDIIHPDDWPEDEKVWKHSVDTGNDFQLEQRVKRKDGQYRWHLSRGLAQRDGQGNINLWIGTNTDIHDHKSTSEELKRINNDLDNFIYTASHDLKSPVTNLEGLITLAKNKFLDKINKNDQQLLGMMDTSVHRLRNTIAGLTEITKAQKGAGERAEQVSFKEILEDVKADLLTETENSGATIKEELKILKIFYPKKDIRSIIYNLLSNAIKYRSDLRPLTIEVRTYREKEHVVLSVHDNGVGLSEQQLPKLFTMFKRLHSIGEGTGIGLYIVKRMVENNGGSIEVASKENEGTSFKIFFAEAKQV